MRDERTSENLGDEDDDDETSVDIKQPFVLFSGSATSKQGYQTDYYTFNTAVVWGNIMYSNHTENNDGDGEIIVVLDVVVSQELQEVFSTILSVAAKTDQYDSDQKEDTIDENQEIFDKIIQTIFHPVLCNLISKSGSNPDV